MERLSLYGCGSAVLGRLHSPTIVSYRHESFYYRLDVNLRGAAVGATSAHCFTIPDSRTAS